MNKLLPIILVIILAVGFSLKQRREEQISHSTNLPATCVQKLACPDCNLILLSVDSLRADHVGAFGYQRGTTPNFDALSEQGILFTNYFTTSFLTPVTEMSVHSGLYPTSSGVTNFDTLLPDNVSTLSQILKKEQYLTSALLSSPEFYVNPALKTNFSRGFDRYKYHTDSSFSRDVPSIASINSELDQLAKNKFFWWLVIGEIHWPYGQFTKNRFADSNYHGFFKDYYRLDWPTLSSIYQKKAYPSAVLLNEADIQYVKDVYDDGVYYFDRYLGKLIDLLQEKKLMDKTILVIASEHGEGLGEHGYFAHYDVFDTEVHTPLLIITPKIKNGQKVDSLASSVDVLPTVSELLGLAVPTQVQGKSLGRVICGEQPKDEEQTVFIERNPLWEEVSFIKMLLKGKGIEVGGERHKDIAIRTKKWKYIWRKSRSQLEKISWWGAVSGQKINIPEAELYNLEADPLETENVVDKYPAVAQQLRKQLENWLLFVSKKSPSEKFLPTNLQEYF